MLTEDVFGPGVRVSPCARTEDPGRPEPGDLSLFERMRTVAPAEGRRDPFWSAPLDEGCGGAVFFDNHVSRDDMDGYMRMMQICQEKDFAVFIAESELPKEDGYLTQARIVSRFALRHKFGVITDNEYRHFPEQDVSITEALWLFTERARERWGTSFGSSGLAGKFGGDGYFAREQLGFGFVVEHEYYRIYRIWSRAWLVHK